MNRVKGGVKYFVLLMHKHFLKSLLSSTRSDLKTRLSSVAHKSHSLTCQRGFQTNQLTSAEVKGEKREDE